jgi:BASS family bile acid:Na+ symporter
VSQVRGAPGDQDCARGVIDFAGASVPSDQELKAGGHGSYTISLVVATSLLAAAIVPASLWIIGRLFGLPLSAPIGNVIKVVATTLLVPMGIGIAVAHFRPAAAHAGKRVMTLATIVLAVAVVPILFTSWPTFRGFVGDGTLAVIVAFTLTGLCVGYVLGGPEPEHRTVLALATASRHPAVALAIATANFPGNKLIVPALLLALLVSAAASTPFVMKSRKRARERLHSQAAMTGDDAEQERISFRGTPDQAPVAHAPDRPKPLYHRKRVPVWGFALFLLGSQELLCSRGARSRGSWAGAVRRRQPSETLPATSRSTREWRQPGAFRICRSTLCSISRASGSRREARR